MGKNRRTKLGPSRKSTPHKLTRPSSITKSHPKPSTKSKPSTGTDSTKPPQKKPHHQAQHTLPTIPFSPSDTILCIGEADLSFSLSLLSHHRCENLTSTTLESREELISKYPNAEENIKLLEEGGGGLRFGIDATKGKLGKGGGWKGMGGVKFDRIIFNFPHTGGRSTDVNRQVRGNQELLVSFLTHAIPSLLPTPGSSIIITLFEGSPYTLWNIRDLARHAGLEVKESFRFQASVYPGYAHCRTLGVVRGKGGEETGWKGEERKARSYVFVRKGEGQVQGGGERRKENGRREKGEGWKGGRESEEGSSGDEESEVGDFEVVGEEGLVGVEGLEGEEGGSDFDNDDGEGEEEDMEDGGE